MTSRKNQQAARQYMREHDVPYMEALRRVTSASTPKKASTASAPCRPLDEPLVLGYMPPPPREESKPSLLGRFRKKPEQNTSPAPAPYVMHADGGWPNLVTVFGPPGTGKTMLLRAILEQFRGYAAYVVHDGHLLNGPTTLPNGERADRIEPWEGLTEIDLGPWLSGVFPTGDPAEAPTPPAPAFGEVPFGALVVFDINGARLLLESEEPLPSGRETVEAIRPWLEFEANVGRMARARSFTVATSVMSDNRADPRRPLSLLRSPLVGSNMSVRMDRSGFSAFEGGRPWVYEAFANSPDSPPQDYFLLTEQEARQFTLSPSVA